MKGNIWPAADAFIRTRLYLFVLDFHQNMYQTFLYKPQYNTIIFVQCIVIFIKSKSKL